MSDRPTAEVTDSRGLPVVVIGAGLAGLVCALALHDVGQRVLVLEASDGVGGRIRSDRHREGFILDRGFQVLLDAYPAPRRWVDFPALRPLAFDAGASVWTGKRLVPLANPLLHPTAAGRDLTSSIFGFPDKLRLAKLALMVRSADWQSAADAARTPLGQMSAEEALWASGFGKAFIDRFARRFWGGILLDPALRQSAGPLLFTLKMFLEGRAVLPAEGVGMMSDHLAQRLPAGTIRLNTTVGEILRNDGGAAIGVIAGGENIAAAAVVVAVDPPAARRLTGIESLPVAADGLGSLTLFLAGPRDPGIGPRLAIDGTGRGVVNHLAPLSAVQPSYAREGMHLLAAVCVGDALARDDDDLAEQARLESAAMLGHRPGDWRVLDVRRIPFSQFAQPPGIFDILPGNETATPGLFLASEATVDSSYNGATLSGEGAARAVLRHLARQSRGRAVRAS
jgi:phytoene dehydrogenase-like protein